MLKDENCNPDYEDLMGEEDEILDQPIDLEYQFQMLLQEGFFDGRANQ